MGDPGAYHPPKFSSDSAPLAHPSWKSVTMILPRRRVVSLVLLVLSLTCPTLQAAQNATKNESQGKPGRHGKGRSFESNPLPGSRAIVSILAEGTIVKAGDLVCELDSSPFRDALENLAIEIASIEADLKNQKLSIEAAELAMKEEEERVGEERDRLANASRLAKTEVELMELRVKENSNVSNPESVALKKAKDKAGDLETQLAASKSSEDRLGPLIETVETSRKEERACLARLETLRAEFQSLTAKIALCRMTARTGGRVVLARWRPNPSSPEGYAVLEPSALVVEAQPIFRISPTTGKPARSSAGKPLRQRPGGTPPGGVTEAASPIPKG